MAKKQPEVSGFIPDPNPEQVLTIEYNPATDPTKTAQERLDALTEQHRVMHADQAQKDAEARK